jgi:hypothetical protein
MQIVLCACAPYQFQARMKQLAVGYTGEDYIVLLPPSPANLLAQYPRVAARLFDQHNLPVGSPLCADAVSFVRCQINLRPNRGNSNQFALRAEPSVSRRGNAQMTPQMMMTGLRKHACMHACIHACVMPQQRR